jgi:hypothetical protein
MRGLFPQDYSPILMWLMTLLGFHDWSKQHDNHWTSIFPIWGKQNRIILKEIINENMIDANKHLRRFSRWSKLSKSLQNLFSENNT